MLKLKRNWIWKFFKILKKPKKKNKELAQYLINNIVAFQVFFYLKIYQNNIFYFLKIIFNFNISK
jgi:hypothetical protein